MTLWPCAEANTERSAEPCVGMAGTPPGPTGVAGGGVAMAVGTSVDTLSFSVHHSDLKSTLPSGQAPTNRNGFKMYNTVLKIVSLHFKKLTCVPT
eukprot:2894922-Amphidinium_carterae.1